MQEEIKVSPKTALIAIITMCLTVIVCVGLVCSKVTTPDKTDIHHTNYTDKSQWQAMMILNNEQLPWEIIHFTYEPEENYKDKNERMIAVFRSKCMFWISSPILLDYGYISKTGQNIQCFTKKLDLKKYEKD